MPSFEEYQSQTLAPGWLRDERGSAFLKAFGAAKDALAARAKLAVKSRFPYGVGRGNWLVRSQELDHATWTKVGGCTVTPNTDVAPDGTQTVDTVNLPGVTDYVAQSVTVDPLGSEWTFSVWLAGTPGQSIALTLISVGGTTESTTFGITLTSALKRYSVTRRFVASHTGVQGRIWRGGAYDATAVKTWGTQLEPAGVANHYVPTFSEAVPCLDAAPADALALIARERGIDRGVTEAEGHHRARVRAAWDVWRWAGTPYGLLLALHYAGYRPSSGKAIIQTETERRYELRSDFDPAVHTPENALIITNIGPVSLGGVPELWSDVAVIFVDPLPPSWSPTPPSDGSAEVEGIRSLVRRWKPAHARCVKLQVSGGRLIGYPLDDTFNTYTGQTIGQVGSGVSATWTPPSG